MNDGSSNNQPAISLDQPDASLGVDSRLVIHRGYFNGPFGSGSFTVDVGYPFSGHLVQLIPIAAAGKSCTVDQITSAPGGNNNITVTYQVQRKEDLAQLAYILFVTA